MHITFRLKAVGAAKDPVICAWCVLATKKKVFALAYTPRFEHSSNLFAVGSHGAAAPTLEKCKASSALKKGNSSFPGGTYSSGRNSSIFSMKTRKS